MGSSGGSFDWATAATNKSSAPFYIDRSDVALSGSGDVYVVGTLPGAAQGQAPVLVSFGATNLTSRGGNDIFVAKLDPTGAFAWAISGGSTTGDTGNGIAIGSTGDVYVTGRVGGSSVFGTVFLAAWSLEVVVLRVSANGKFLAGLRGGGLNASGDSIGVDASNHIFVTGYFFGGTFNGHSVQSAGYSDVFAWSIPSL